MMRALSAWLIQTDFTEHNTNQIGEADYYALAFHSVSNVSTSGKVFLDFRGAASLSLLSSFLLSFSYSPSPLRVLLFVFNIRGE